MRLSEAVMNMAMTRARLCLGTTQHYDLELLVSPWIFETHFHYNLTPTLEDGVI